jgi:hypothetical protein
MSDTDLDLDLEARLSALAARAPGRDDPPALTRANRRRRLAIPMTLAPLLVLALVATAGAAVVAVNQLAHADPGIENPGQPLEGAGLECMSPPAAAVYLAAHGYPDVVWEVQTGAISNSKGSGGGFQRSTPPDHGFVIPASVLDDGKLHIVVDQRVGSTGTGACFGMPMP